MVHATERRIQLRGMFVYKRMPMEACCQAMGIPRSTANRWKQDAKNVGDDWESARAAITLGDENFMMMSKRLLEDYLVQHQNTIDLLKTAKDIDPHARAQILASLADSFNKTMSSFKRMMPELNRHALALDALNRLASFAQQKYPKHVPALLEMLEPFGAELAKAYG